jgi:hypothetical protein
MKNISPFDIRKTFGSIAGKVINASRLKNGTLVVEARNEKEAEVLLKASLLGSHPAKVERQTSLNFCRGVIETDSPDGMSDEGTQSAFADHLVSRACRLL